MPREVRVYGIPTCSTVRKATAWLDARGVPYTSVDLRQAGLEPARAARWVQALGAGALKNTSGGAYRALSEEKSTWDDARWATELSAEPMLVKRPVIEIDGEPVMAGFRDPEILVRALQEG